MRFPLLEGWIDGSLGRLAGFVALLDRKGVLLSLGILRELFEESKSELG
jgi:hypothetical protein